VNATGHGESGVTLTLFTAYYGHRQQGGRPRAQSDSKYLPRSLELPFQKSRGMTHGMKGAYREPAPPPGGASENFLGWKLIAPLPWQAQICGLDAVGIVPRAKRITFELSL
jgi:hypothetical protein